MKTVVFIDGTSDRLEQRLKTDNPKYTVITKDSDELLTDEDKKTIADAFYPTKINQNRDKEKTLSLTRKRFGDLLRDPSIELVIIKKTNLADGYLKMFEEESIDIHFSSVTTIIISVSVEIKPVTLSEDGKEMKEILEKDIENDFYFISGSNVKSLTALFQTKSSTKCIDSADIHIVDSEYIKAMNNTALDLITMNATKFTFEDKNAFKRFPPSQGFMVQNITVAKDPNEDTSEKIDPNLVQTPPPPPPEEKIVTKIEVEAPNLDILAKSLKLSKGWTENKKDFVLRVIGVAKSHNRLKDGEEEALKKKYEIIEEEIVEN